MFYLFFYAQKALFMVRQISTINNVLPLKCIDQKFLFLIWSCQMWTINRAFPLLLWYEPIVKYSLFLSVKVVQYRATISMIFWANKRMKVKGKKNDLEKSEIKMKSSWFLAIVICNHLSSFLFKFKQNISAFAGPP